MWGREGKVSGAFAPMACPVTMDTTRWEKPWRKAFSTVWGENGALVNRVAFLVGNHMHFGPARFLPDAALWRWLRKEARSGAFRCTKDLQEAFRELGTLCLADMAATTASAESQALARHFADQLFLMAGTMPVHTADLAISGRDLIAAGIPQRVLKRLLPLLLSRVQDRNLSNTPEALQRAADIWWKKEKEKGPTS